MHAAVPIIIICIICVQIFFFVKNLLRMQQFRNIFINPVSWQITRDSETRLVNGIDGQGNTIFRSIINSINKYLGYNTGSVIDFGLLKDAVDRHCDSVENDISTQTPIPLYWGLAGTMLGVIIGLWDLLASDSIKILMGSSGEDISAAGAQAASGVDALLSGVAWAMVASICGIVFTTTSSLLFKRCKLKEEEGKNSFLAWMQSELLPELPSDTSQALNNLVKNLNKFNNTFAQNTSNLGNALNAVNQSYAIQADIIKAVHDMDVMKMAKANVHVLQELKECTDKLEVFNEYLTDIEGYTETIHRFETLFNEQADRLHVLEEIRDFFMRHKSEIAKTTADADHILQESLDSIKESTASNVDELHARFVEQSEAFKVILKEEKESFEQISSQMKAQFSTQLDKMPQLSKQLEEISSIPVRLDKLIEKIEKSNTRLASDVSLALKEATKGIKSTPAIIGGGGGGGVIQTTPSWMKLTGLIGILIIALACIFHVVTYFFPKEEKIVPVETVIETPSPEPAPVEENKSSTPSEVQQNQENGNTVANTEQQNPSQSPDNNNPHP